MLKAHQVVAATLANRGVDTIFGLMGDKNMLYLTDYIRDHRGRFVRAASETSAVSMADGYGRSSGRVGVSSVAHGAALANTLTPLVEAVRAHSSVLVMTGATPAQPAHFQSIDVVGICDVAGAGYERVRRPSTTRQDLHRALHRACSESRPIVVDIPYDLLECDVDDNSFPPEEEPKASRPERPDLDALDDALGLAVSAWNPVVLAGRGAVRSGARIELIRLAEALGAPLATSLLAKDYFRGHPDNLGVCGTLATDLATSVIAKSDCVLAFGASLNSYTADSGRALSSDQRVVHCDTMPAHVGLTTPVEIGLIGDARTTAAAMLELLGRRNDNRGAAPNEDLRREIAATAHDAFTDRSSGTTVDLRTAMIRFDEMLPAEKVVVTDVGRFMIAPWRYLHVTHPLDFVHTTSFGSVGLGLSTALGSAIARPDRPTVAVLGGGGFMMNAQGLHTAVRNDLPLLIVIANDGAYGAEWRKLSGFGVDPNYSCSDWPDFTDLAAGLGVEGIAVRNLDDLDALAPRLSTLSGPLLVDLSIDPELDPFLRCP